MPTPRLISELAEAIGYQPTVRLIRAYGGRRLYVPRRADPEHPISLTIGHRAARRLTDLYAGDRLELPDEQTSILDLRNRRIVAEHKRGRQIRTLAAEYGLSPRMIRKILDSAEARRPAKRAEAVPPAQHMITPGQ